MFQMILSKLEKRAPLFFVLIVTFYAFVGFWAEHLASAVFAAALVFARFTVARDAFVGLLVSGIGFAGVKLRDGLFGQQPSGFIDWNFWLNCALFGCSGMIF